MTVPGQVSDDYTTLRRRWWDRFTAVNAQSEKQIRRVLTLGAQNASDRIMRLGDSQTFSAGVRAAQIRLAISEIRAEMKDIFGKIPPILSAGSKDAAAAAVDALAESDRAYLSAAFGDTNAINSLVAVERHSAMLGVQHAITRITKTDQPLSARVYRTRALANHWVQRDVTIGILKGDSAREIAKTVRKHIRPDVPGGVSYAALRLARTELNNAFHATAISLSQDRPWVENMAWNLSARHEIDPVNPEICEQYSLRIFHVDNVPPKPHPQCRCFVTPVLEDFNTFLTHLTAGQYRDWIQHERVA